MAIQGLSTLKNWFRTGLKPTQSQFWDWLDSFWHKSDSIPMSQVSGLDDALNSKASQSSFDALDVRVTAIEAGGGGGGVAPTYYQEIDGLSGNTITTANPLPTMSQGQKINLFRTGVRLRYTKDFTISGTNQIILIEAATNEDFTLIYQS